MTEMLQNFYIEVEKRKETIALCTYLQAGNNAVRDCTQAIPCAKKKTCDNDTT